MHSCYSLIILTVNKNVIAVTTLLPYVHSSYIATCCHKSIQHFISQECLSINALMKHSLMAKMPDWQWLDYLAPHDMPASLIHSMKHINLHNLPIMEAKYRRHSQCLSFINCYTNAHSVNQVTPYVLWVMSQRSWSSRFDVLKMVNITITIFTNKTPWSSVDRCQSSGRNCSLHLQEGGRSHFLSFPEDWGSRFPTTWHYIPGVYYVKYYYHIMITLCPWNWTSSIPHHFSAPVTYILKDDEFKLWILKYGRW
jgi:hypothetical protein